jgi:hypothetical protein
MAYFADFDSIIAIETESFTLTAKRQAICCMSGVVGLHPNGHTVYGLGNEFGGFIVIADLRRPSPYAPFFFVRGQTLGEFDSQTDIAFRPDGTQAYLPGSIGLGGSLFVVDTSDPWTPIPQRVIALEKRPSRIGLTDDGLRAYLLNYDSSITVLDVDSGTTVSTIAGPAEAHQIVVGPANAPATPSPVSAGSEGGCHVARAQGSSEAAALLFLAILVYLRRGAAAAVELSRYSRRAKRAADRRR